MHDSQPRNGFALLSAILMSLLLAGQWLFMVQQQQHWRWLALNYFADTIVDRRNLIRAMALQLERMPTAAELAENQQSSAIIWDYQIQSTQPDSLQWRLLLPRQAWGARLVDKHGGAVEGQHWYSEEGMP